MRILYRILRLKRERSAVIFMHNYQPEVQDIADFTGDSLELAHKRPTFRRMSLSFAFILAGPAAILNPDKTVLLPDGPPRW